MPSVTFWVFIAVAAYLIIGEALLRVRRNTKRGKHAEEVFGIRTFRIFNLVIGVLLIAAAFIWYFK